jgi:hypothetical protein
MATESLFACIGVHPESETMYILAVISLSVFLLAACEPATTPQVASCKGLSQSDCGGKSECQWNAAKNECEAR